MLNAAYIANEDRAGRDEVALTANAMKFVREVTVIETAEWPMLSLSLSSIGASVGVFLNAELSTKLSSTPIPSMIKGKIECKGE